MPIINMAVAKYIEQNPKRAKIIKKEEDYIYSSAKVHLRDKRDEILEEELFKEGQRKDNIELLRTSTLKEHIIGVNYSTRTGRYFGSGDLIKMMEIKFD